MEMPLKDTEKLLIYRLKYQKATKDEIMSIMLMLPEPKEQWALLQWIARNRTASMDEVFQKALDLVPTQNSVVETKLLNDRN